MWKTYIILASEYSEYYVSYFYIVVIDLVFTKLLKQQLLHGVYILIIDKLLYNVNAKKFPVTSLDLKPFFIPGVRIMSDIYLPHINIFRANVIYLFAISFFSTLSSGPFCRTRYRKWNERGRRAQFIGWADYETNHREEINIYLAWKSTRCLPDGGRVKWSVIS